MAYLKDLLVTGPSRFIEDIHGNNIYANSFIGNFIGGFANGEALIGNAQGGITTRQILNNTGAQDIGWSDNNTSIKLINQNSIAYWNGAYNSGTGSNLRYFSDAYFNSNAFIPRTTGTYNLGSSSYKWDQVYLNSIQFRGSSYTRNNYITSNAQDNIFFSVNGINSLVVTTADLRPGSGRDISLGTSSNKWYGLYTNSLQVPNSGTITSSLPIKVTHASGGQKEFQIVYGDNIDFSLMVGTANSNHGLYDSKKGTNGTWILSADSTNHNWSFNGNASTATTANTAATTKALKTADITTGSDITSHADVIQQYFSANYNSVPRKSLLSFYSDKKSPGSQYFGYYIDNYNTNPCGSFFAMHYNDDPVYIGISNGTYTERALLTDQYAYFDSSGNFIPRSVTNLGSTSNKWDILYARQAKIGDYLTIGASGSGNNAKTISSSDNLYLKSDSSSIIFQGNSASIAQFDSSATYAFRPNLDKGHSLGTSSYRWNNLYINTIHFGGSSYDNYITSDGSTNIYFNIQGNNSLVLEKNDIRPGTNKNISLGTLTNKWNKIYAKTYYPSYTWTIQSTHNSESLPFTLATTNDGEGANVPSGFYLIMVSVIYKPSNQTSFSFLCGGGIIPWINGIEEDFASYNFEQVIQSFGSATAQSLKLNLNGSEGYTRIRIHNSGGNAAIKIEKGKAQVYFLRIGDLKPE